MKPSPSQIEAGRNAGETIASIERLLKDADFRLFMGGFKRRADEMADQILHNDSMDPAERESLRQMRLGILEVLKGPQTIIQGSQSILKAAGGS